jgi:hypothetical protein
MASKVSAVLPFAKDLDATKIRVQAPTAVVFLCGGQCSNINDKIPLSLRDAFLKILDNPALKGREIYQAEEITAQVVFTEHYQDLLQFETDFAQIAELILLFCESEGSLAELGAFSMVDEISARLLVVIRDKHWDTDSFVKRGPLKAIENRHGETAVYVIDDIDIGISDKTAADIKIDVLKQRLQEPIKVRLEKTREPTTFDQKRAGHVIKLIVGLVQEYGALAVEEIEHLLRFIGVERQASLIRAYLHCAEAVKWITVKRKGSTTYYFALNVSDAATISWNGNPDTKNRLRRRLLIREHWKQCDEVRYRGITEASGGGAR